MSAVCVRRVHRTDFFTISNSFSPNHSRSSFRPGAFNYRAAQICWATSNGADQSALICISFEINSEACVAQCERDWHHLAA